MMNLYGWRAMGSNFGVGWILTAVFWVLLGFLFVFLVVKLATHGSDFVGKDMKNSGSESALEILKKRYAKGEITLKEFEKMRQDIS